ncbi:hypothetical protein BB561_004663 [Smittium simulii]|uniref:t-SNARE coiled-coil homology domain-containing protein n=1 Tax=Smittium simulii TaxID=133385 RepID=A0A2T9YEY2_9FUNG|nr:hypothetical protein BB561_004663 [Smittium simulii]
MGVAGKQLNDRTFEFRELTKALRKRQDSQGVEGSIQSGQGKNSKKSEFTVKARTIARDISDTIELLEELGALFEDYSQDINASSNYFRGMAEWNNNECVLIDANNAGEAEPCADQWHNVVILLQSQLANTSNVFKEVLETRRENLFEVNSRRDRLISGKPGLRIELPGPESYLKKRNNQPRVAPVTDSRDEFVALSLPTFGQEQSQQLLLAEQQDSYLESRSTAISSIESTIAELGGIFQQLSQMVAEQSDLVQRIDDQTDQIQANISGAHSELLRYYSGLMSNRWLMVQVFLVLIVTVFLFVTFS